MANYKVIFKATSNEPGAPTHWEPGCPLLIKAVQVARDTQTGDAYLQLKLWNLTDKTIGSFVLKAEITYQDGTRETVEVNPLDADIAPCYDYKPEPISLAHGNVDKVEARILAVTCGGAGWQSAQVAQPIPHRAPLNLGQQALAERRNILAALGKSADKYPTGVLCEDDWWICPCGAPNVGRSCCLACNMPLDTLRQLENENYLHAKAKARSASRKSTKRRIVFGVLAAAIALIAIGFGIATVKCNNAMTLYEAGNYTGALGAFSEVSLFPPASGMIEQTSQRLEAQAMEAYDQGDWSTAYDLFRALGDQGSSNAKMMESITQSTLDAIRDLEGYVDADLSSCFHWKDGSSRWSGDDLVSCLFRLDRQGSCVVQISESKWPELNGTWEGTWDPKALTVTLPGFPGGEEWTIGGERERNLISINGSSQSTTKTGKMYRFLDSDTGAFAIDRS